MQVIQNIKKFIDHFRSQGVAGEGSLLLREGPGLVPQLLRETARKTVHTDAADQPVDPAGLEIRLAFCEDAADLPVMIVEIVYPLDAGFHAAHRLNGPGGGYGGGHGDIERPVDGEIRRQAEGDVQTRSGGGFEPAAVASPAPGLPVGDHNQGFPAERPFLHHIIGGSHRVVHFHCAVPVNPGHNPLQTQNIGFRQPVARIRPAFDEVPFFFQFRHRFPDRIAADSQIFSGLLAGYEFTGMVGEQLQKFGFRRHHSSCGRIALSYLQYMSPGPAAQGDGPWRKTAGRFLLTGRKISTNKL